jgi:hypothetical protein
VQENEPQKLVEKVAGDIENLLDRKVQALKVGLGGIKERTSGVALTESNIPALHCHTALGPLNLERTIIGRAVPTGTVGSCSRSRIILSGAGHMRGDLDSWHWAALPLPHTGPGVISFLWVP